AQAAPQIFSAIMCKGITVTDADRGSQLLRFLDEDMARIVHAECRARGLELRFGMKPAAFEEVEGGVAAVFEGGERIEAGLVVLAVGVKPDAGLAAGAGLAIGETGGIAVNSRMQTSDPDIYAVGDAVEIENAVTGRKALIALAGPANKQARVAADNICGKPSRYLGSPASCILKVFGKAVASTGVNERAARALGMDYDKVVLFPASHAGYYPGGGEMMMKVLWSRGSGRILGAQIIGADGVDKRCDVIAAAMQAGMEARELAGLDLAYAPPYGSAKDPVNMAGFMIENIEDGLVRQFHWHDVPALQGDAQAFLLDARTPAEYAAGHAPGFVNIPLDSLRDRLGEIPPGKTVYVMCRSGVRSYIGCRILEQNGFSCRNFSGGYAFYKAAA
ncbi:MAG: FAD-dependent oxidoreductase, partial [Duodenibacillus sp.]|nr:FAD-dependent oxidoreductase [Duodenibacillus sp.]